MKYLGYPQYNTNTSVTIVPTNPGLMMILVISQNNFFRFLTLDDIEPTFIPSPDNSYCEDSRP